MSILNVKEANEIAWSNQPKEFQWHMEGIKDRCSRGLFTYAVSFMPRPTQEELEKLGYKVERKFDNFIEVTWDSAEVEKYLKKQTEK